MEVLSPLFLGCFFSVFPCSNICRCKPVPTSGPYPVMENQAHYLNWRKGWISDHGNLVTDFPDAQMLHCYPKHGNRGNLTQGIARMKHSEATRANSCRIRQVAKISATGWLGLELQSAGYIQQGKSCSALVHAFQEECSFIHQILYIYIYITTNFLNLNMVQTRGTSSYSFATFDSGDSN